MDNRSSAAPAPPGDVMRRYVEADGRSLHYRVAGTGPAVVMLHDSPRSSRLHLATMRALSQRFRVYAIDTPGYGNSEALEDPDATIEDFAAALAAAIRALGIEGAPIYATHTSAKIALQYAAASTGAPGRLILDGLSIPAVPADPAFIAAYMRPFVVDMAGGYIAAEWTRMRDMLRWFPWFDRSPTSRMPIAQPTPEWIDAYMIDFLSAGSSYSSAYAAAMRYDPMPALLQVKSPVLVAARADDVLYGSLDRVPVDRNAALTVERLTANADAWLVWLERTLASATNGAPAAPSLPPQPASGAIYVDLPHGQMRVHRRGPADDIPLLILSAPTTLHALAWQEALPGRDTLVPELPGFGESDPLPALSLDATADVLAALLQRLGCDQVQLLASGHALPLACTLARRHPDVIDRIVLDGCGVADTEPDRIAPAFLYDSGGGHIHRYWHMLRDGEINWPWHDGAADAVRTTTPILAPHALHDALLGILKQPRHYGDIVRSPAPPEGFAKFKQAALLLDRPNDPAYGETRALAARLPGASVIERPADLAGAARIVSRFLAETVSGRESVL